MAKVAISIPEPRTARYSFTEEASTPLLSVREGDYVNITCANLQSENRGSFVITATYTVWGGSAYEQYFEIENEDATAQSAVDVLTTEDFIFFRPETSSLDSGGVIIQDGVAHWTLSLPATTQVVSRTENQAAYLQAVNTISMADDV